MLFKYNSIVLSVFIEKPRYHTPSNRNSPLHEPGMEKGIAWQSRMHALPYVIPSAPHTGLIAFEQLQYDEHTP